MTDRRVILTVVVLLGMVSLLGLAGVIWLVNGNHSADSVAVVVGLTGPPVGALGALLVSTHSAPAPDAPPAPVVVQQPPDQPVPVTEPQGGGVAP